MSRKSWRLRWMSFLLGMVGLLFAFPTPTFGISGTSPAALEGEPIPPGTAERAGWPDGTLAILNDPLRGDGWNPWFSEWPNDQNHYEMKVTGTEDVQHLIELLVEIKESAVQIRLDARREPRGLGFMTSLSEGNGIGAMFSIGSQERIDGWYQRLEEVERGGRKFGGFQMEKPPVALPPTLTLYVGNSAIDLASLRIPPQITVRAGFDDRYREEHKDDDLVKQIEAFVKEHEVKRVAHEGSAENAGPEEAAE